MYDVKNISSQFTEEEAENYLLAVFSGLISKDSLSYEYHQKVGSKLYDGVLKGFGARRYSDFEREILEGLTENIYVFSAAKQYTQVRIMSSMIDDKMNFDDFQKQAMNVFEEFNSNYLATEFNTAITQSDNAKKWAKILAEREIFPLLQYKTQNDALVRDSHAELHDIIRPVNDSFWDNNMPANGWGCRCFTQQLEAGDVSTNIPELSEEDQPVLFRMNPGKDKYIFDEKKHPYFSIARGDKPLRDNNYNLPI